MYRAIGVVKGSIRVVAGATLSDALMAYVHYWNVDPLMILTNHEYLMGVERVPKAIKQLRSRGIV